MTQFPYLDIDDRVATIDTWFDFDQTDLVSAPDYGALKRSENKNKGITFGDGYKSSYIFGLNSLRPEWDMTFTVNIQNANDFEVVLTRYCGEKNTIVEWVPPDSSVASNWRIDDWSAVQSSHSAVTFSVILRKVFELILPQAVPVLVECDQDYLCETDLGDYYVDPLLNVWLARLNGTTTGSEGLVSSYSSNSYTTDNGDIFLVYNFSGTLNISKFDQNGNHIWSRAYPALAISFNDGPIAIDANEKENLLLIAGQYYYSPWQSFAAPITMFVCAIDIAYGAYAWGRVFVNNGFWQTGLAPGVCIPDESGPGAQFTSFRYLPLSDTVVFRSSATNCSTAFSGTSGAPLQQYRQNAGVIIEQGKLGSDTYTIGLTSSNVPCVCAGSSPYLPSEGYLLPSAGGRPASIVRFLGNGQLVVVWITSSTTAGVTTEIAIYGAGMQKQVHVSVPAFVFRATLTSWSGSIASSGFEMRFMSCQAFLDQRNEKIFFYYYPSVFVDSGIGAYCVELSVTMSGTQVTDISYVSRTTIIYGSNGGSNVSKVFGASKYSGNNFRSPRVTAAAATYLPTLNAEVCLLSYYRNFGQGSIPLSISPITNVFGTASNTYYSDITIRQASTAGLVGGAIYGSTGGGSYTLPLQVTPGKEECGSQFTAPAIIASAVDVTSSRSFSLQYFALE
jgi:phage-related protein